MDLLAEAAEGQAGLATQAGAAGAENMQDRVQAFLTTQNTQAAPNLLTQTEDELTNPAIMRGRDNNASLVEATPDAPATAPGGEHHRVHAGATDPTPPPPHGRDPKHPNNQWNCKSAG